MTFRSRIAGDISDLRLLDYGDRAVAAVSGGPDSVAMLHLLVRIRDAGGTGWRIDVAHLHHGIRGADADADADFVAQLADALGLPFHLGETDVPAIRRREGGSIETVARRERYAFLERVARRIGSTRIAVAHHADDQAETVLFRALRGAGLRGLAGIPVRRPLAYGSEIEIVRPLLGAARAEIMDYLAQNGLDYRVDRTNLTPIAERNRLRLDVLPRLEDQSSGVRDELIRLGAMAGSLDARLRALAQGMLDEMAEARPDALWLRVERMAQIPAALRAVVVREALDRTLGRPSSVAQSHLDRAVALFRGAGSGVLQLPRGLRVSREQDVVRFYVESDLSPPAAFEGVLSPAGETVIQGTSFRAETIDGGPAEFRAFVGTKTCWQEMFDLDRLRMPLSVRTRRPGDRFRPLGLGGEKKLHDFFIDRRVPRSMRDRVPLVVADHRPVWIVGYAIDDRAGVNESTTRLLKLTAQHPEGR